MPSVLTSATWNTNVFARHIHVLVMTPELVTMVTMVTMVGPCWCRYDWPPHRGPTASELRQAFDSMTQRSATKRQQQQPAPVVSLVISIDCTGAVAVPSRL
eukprot:COSAG01_NODE_3404_length_6132_cov_7.368971_4_plen_101_part_00